MKEIMMQLVNATNALIFILLVCNTYADEHEIHFAKIEKIPAAIKPDSGKIIAAIEYVDKIGHKAVIIIQYEKGQSKVP